MASSALICESEEWKDLRVMLCLMFEACFGSGIW